METSRPPDLLEGDKRRQALAVGVLRVGLLVALVAELLANAVGSTLTHAGVAMRCAAILAVLAAFGLQRVRPGSAATALTLGTALMLPVATFALDPGSQAGMVYVLPLWSLSLMFLVAWHYSTRVAATAGTLVFAVMLMAPLLIRDLDPAAVFRSGVFFMVMALLILYSYATRRATLRVIGSQASALADREARLRNILDMAFDGIAILCDGRLEDANPAFCQLLGVDRETLPAYRFADLVAQGSRHHLNEDGEIAGERPVEIDLVHSGGALIPVEAACRPYVHGEVRSWVLTVRDLRERRAGERLRSELLVTASHELRTPLTALHGSICTITDIMASDVPPEVLKLMDAAKKSSSRLVRLVKDLLDAERLESGQMLFHIGEVDLLDVAEDAVSAVHLMAADCGVTIDVAEGSDCVLARGDPDRLVQVVVNLLANAIRWSRSGGTVRVDVGVEGQFAAVSVTDTGAGIPEAFRPRIFERFARRRGQDEEASSGSGLGLYICREIVRAHEGTIEFTSELGVGTTFRFTIPVWEPQAARRSEIPASS